MVGVCSTTSNPPLHPPARSSSTLIINYIMGGRDTHARRALGSLHSRIKQCRVLMVGAGGIGCELLKNLVLTGFGEIHIVDLDTIDLSNLNRQFLFGMQHIKKSKAIVAKETAGRFNPNVKIEAHHANIKDKEFDLQWFKSFGLVFNALDNIDARRHVNKMCLAADVPLIESGTTGYHGQVQTIKQGQTECYDCNPKPVQKSFPICTIRSTPSQPIHCIVWAKSYLFTEIFGTSEESSPELDPSENSENAKEIANLKREAEELKNIRDKMDSAEFAQSVFKKVFTTDIERLRSMEDMWKNRTPPEPMDYAKMLEVAKEIDTGVAKKDQKTWSLAENYVVFADSLHRLAKRMRELKVNSRESDAPPILSFDKDDEDTLDFVAASANLRSSIFSIELKSKFDIKQMAGNIIPAIATTNAITAGMCVLQAFKVLRDELTSGRMVFISKSAERAFTAEKLAPPNPSCETCGVARTTVEADVSRATLGDLVESVLRKGLGYGEELSVLTHELIYDPDFDDNLERPLKSLGFGNETFVTVRDEEETPRVNLIIAVIHSNRAGGPALTVPEKFNIRHKPKIENASEETNGTNGVKRGVSEADESGTVPKKRKLNEEFAVLEDRQTKKQATVSPQQPDDDIILLDDDGVINID